MSYTQLENTVFEMLRRKLVSINRLPDWLSFTGTDAQKQQQYELAKKTLGANLIELFGINDPLELGGKRVNAIQVHIAETSMGNVVTPNRIAYTLDEANNNYIQTLHPHNTFNLRLEVRMITNNPIISRVIREVIVSTFNTVSSIQLIDAQGNFTNEYATIRFVNSADVSGGEYIEQVFAYQFVEVELTEPVVLPTRIPVLTQVDTQYLDY